MYHTEHNTSQVDVPSTDTFTKLTLMQVNQILNSIESFLTGNFRWVVPLGLFILQFLMKLFIADKYEPSKVWSATRYAPVQVGFLALSFTTSIIISSPSKAPVAFVICLFYFIFLTITIIIWKQIPDNLVSSKLLTTILLTIINCMITVPMLVFSILLLLKLYDGNSQ